VAFKNAGASLISVWTTDANGNFTGCPTGGGVSPANPALELLEPGFHQDLNSDGTIGLNPTTVIQIDNGTTLISVGNEYVLEGSNATGPILQYGGSPVTAGEFGSWTPIGAVQQNGGGSLVAWSMPAANQYVVWRIDSNGNYTGGATGAVAGTDFTLEQLETTFNQDLNGNGRLSSVVETGTSGGDSLILTGQTQVATINLGGNTAFVSAGLSAPALTFIGTPDAITLGAAAATIQYALGSASGIETIANFSYGLDLLNIDLAGAASGSLQAYNTTVGGQHAIAIAGGTDPTHGVVLLNMPTGNTAANLLSSHTTFNGGHALII
jgi:serralysin